MNRVFRVGRRRRRVALVTGVVAAVILGLALPASAHSASLSGSTQCFNGDHLVTWHITNTSEISFLPMAVTSIDAKIGNTTYAVTGYTAPVAKGASTDGTSTVPGGVTGTITATLHTSWSDGVTDTDTASVTLQDNCVSSSTTTSTSTSTTTTTTSTTTTTVPETTTTTVPETTTTTVPETTTTVPETTTTTVPETTTTVPETTTTTVPETTTSGPTTTVGGTTTIFTTTTTVPETTTTVPETTTTTVPETTTTEGPTTTVFGSTTIFTTTTTEAPTTTTPVTGVGSTVPIPTVINQATTTTVPGATALPRTGSSSGYAAFFGLSCIAGGALLAIRRRGNWIR